MATALRSARKTTTTTTHTHTKNNNKNPPKEPNFPRVDD